MLHDMFEQAGLLHTQATGWVLLQQAIAGLYVPFVGLWIIGRQLGLPWTAMLATYVAGIRPDEQSAALFWVAWTVSMLVAVAAAACLSALAWHSLHGLARMSQLCADVDVFIGSRVQDQDAVHQHPASASTMQSSPSKRPKHDASRVSQAAATSSLGPAGAINPSSHALDTMPGPGEVKLRTGVLPPKAVFAEAAEGWWMLHSNDAVQAASLSGDALSGWMRSFWSYSSFSYANFLRKSSRTSMSESAAEERGGGRAGTTHTTSAAGHSSTQGSALQASRDADGFVIDETHLRTIGSKPVQFAQRAAPFLIRTVVFFGTPMFIGILLRLVACFPSSPLGSAAAPGVQEHDAAESQALLDQLGGCGSAAHAILALLSVLGILALLGSAGVAVTLATPRGWADFRSRGVLQAPGALLPMDDVKLMVLRVWAAVLANTAWVDLDPGLVVLGILLPCVAALCWILCAGSLGTQFRPKFSLATAPAHHIVWLTLTAAMLSIVAATTMLPGTDQSLAAQPDSAKVTLCFISMIPALAAVFMCVHFYRSRMQRLMSDTQRAVLSHEVSRWQFGAAENDAGQGAAILEAMVSDLPGQMQAHTLDIAARLLAVLALCLPELHHRQTTGTGAGSAHAAAAQATGSNALSAAGYCAAARELCLLLARRTLDPDALWYAAQGCCALSLCAPSALAQDGHLGYTGKASSGIRTPVTGIAVTFAYLNMAMTLLRGVVECPNATVAGRLVSRMELSHVRWFMFSGRAHGTFASGQSNLSPHTAFRLGMHAVNTCVALAALAQRQHAAYRAQRTAWDRLSVASAHSSAWAMDDSARDTAAQRTAAAGRPVTLDMEKLVVAARVNLLTQQMALRALSVVHTLAPHSTALARHAQAWQAQCCPDEAIAAHISAWTHSSLPFLSSEARTWQRCRVLFSKAAFMSGVNKHSQLPPGQHEELQDSAAACQWIVQQAPWLSRGAALRGELAVWVLDSDLATFGRVLWRTPAAWHIECMAAPATGAAPVDHLQDLLPPPLRRLSPQDIWRITTQEVTTGHVTSRESAMLPHWQWSTGSLWIGGPSSMDMMTGAESLQEQATPVPVLWQLQAAMPSRDHNPRICLVTVSLEEGVSLAARPPVLPDGQLVPAALERKARSSSSAPLAAPQLPAPSADIHSSASPSQARQQASPIISGGTFKASTASRMQALRSGGISSVSYADQAAVASSSSFSSDDELSGKRVLGIARGLRGRETKHRAKILRSSKQRAQARRAIGNSVLNVLYTLLDPTASERAAAMLALFRWVRMLLIAVLGFVVVAAAATLAYMNLVLVGRGAQVRTAFVSSYSARSIVDQLLHAARTSWPFPVLDQHTAWTSYHSAPSLANGTELAAPVVAGYAAAAAMHAQATHARSGNTSTRLAESGALLWQTRELSRAGLITSQYSDARVAQPLSATADLTDSPELLSSTLQGASQAQNMSGLFAPACDLHAACSEAALPVIAHVARVPVSPMAAMLWPFAGGLPDPWVAQLSVARSAPPQWSALRLSDSVVEVLARIKNTAGLLADSRCSALGSQERMLLLSAESPAMAAALSPVAQVSSLRNDSLWQAAQELRHAQQRSNSYISSGCYLPDLHMSNAMLPAMNATQFTDVQFSMEVIMDDTMFALVLVSILALVFIVATSGLAYLAAVGVVEDVVDVARLLAKARAASLRSAVAKAAARRKTSWTHTSRVRLRTAFTVLKPCVFLLAMMSYVGLDSGSGRPSRLGQHWRFAQIGAAFSSTHDMQLAIWNAITASSASVAEAHTARLHASLDAARNALRLATQHQAIPASWFTSLFNAMYSSDTIRDDPFAQAFLYQNLCELLPALYQAQQSETAGGSASLAQLQFALGQAMNAQRVPTDAAWQSTCREVGSGVMSLGLSAALPQLADAARIVLPQAHARRAELHYWLQRAAHVWDGTGTSILNGANTSLILVNDASTGSTVRLCGGTDGTAARIQRWQLPNAPGHVSMLHVDTIMACAGRPCLGVDQGVWDSLHLGVPVLLASEVQLFAGQAAVDSMCDLSASHAADAEGVLQWRAPDAMVLGNITLRPTLAWRTLLDMQAMLSGPLSTADLLWSRQVASLAAISFMENQVAQSNLLLPLLAFVLLLMLLTSWAPAVFQLAADRQALLSLGLRLPAKYRHALAPVCGDKLDQDAEVADR